MIKDVGRCIFANLTNGKYMRKKHKLKNTLNYLKYFICLKIVKDREDRVI